QINDAYRLRELVEQIGDISQQSFSGFKATNLAGLLGLPEDASLSDVDKLLDKLAALYDKQPDRIRVTPNNSTQLPDMSQKDAFDRAVDASKRHTDQLAAETDAI